MDFLVWERWKAALSWMLHAYKVQPVAKKSNIQCKCVVIGTSRKESFQTVLNHWYMFKLSCLLNVQLGDILHATNMLQNICVLGQNCCSYSLPLSIFLLGGLSPSFSFLTYFLFSRTIASPLLRSVWRSWCCLWLVVRMILLPSCMFDEK